MKRFIALAIVLLFLAGIMLGYGAGMFFPQPQVNTPYHEVHMSLPAVRSDGTGMVANLTTLVKPGTGMVLVNINKVFAGFETQRSAKTASQVASEFTGKALNSVDIIYLIEADASSIEGPSAGAAMTVSTIAALQGMELNQSIMMTGSIDDAGNIGSASGIPAKVKVGQESGARLFLVPKGQSVVTDFVKETACTLDSSVNYCTLDYVEGGSSFAIAVKEVSDVDEAWGYFV